MADLEAVATASAQSEQGVTFTVYQPDDNPYKGPDGKDVTISVVGKESKAYRDAENIITRRALKKRRQITEPEELRQNRIDLAVACITGWSGWENGKQPLPFTAENARKLLAHRHILEQVEEAIGAHAANFTKTSTSSPTSSSTSAG
jgi:hypothetical protein